MYVCACRAVTDREVHGAVAAGAVDLEDLAAHCGAGATCGGCVPALLDILADHGLASRPDAQAVPDQAA